MAPVARQIAEVAVRALLHRVGGAVSVDMAILLVSAANQGTSGHAQVHQFTTTLTAAKRGLAVMQADATRLQRRLAQLEAEVAQWQARAEWALQESDEALARQALARKLQLQRLAGQYADTLSAQQRSLDQVDTAVVQVEARLRAVQGRRAPGVRARPGQVNTRVVGDHETVEAR